MVDKEVVKTESPTFSTAVMTVFDSLHKKIGPNYQNPDGSKAYCDIIAIQLAISLINDGEVPTIATIESKDPNNQILVSFLPKKFELRPIPWFRHNVCISNGMVLDPIAENPIPLPEYLETFFTKPVEVSKEISTDQLNELFSEK